MKKMVDQADPGRNELRRRLLAATTAYGVVVKGKDDCPAAEIKDDTGSGAIYDGKEMADELDGAKEA